MEMGYIKNISQEIDFYYQADSENCCRDRFIRKNNKLKNILFVFGRIQVRFNICPSVLTNNWI